MPTTQPRYTVTDTGEMREMLDLAHRRWPEIDDRRQLLLRLADLGAERLAAELDSAVAAERQHRQRKAMKRARKLIDEDGLLSDAAWR